ncbi:ArsR family transcriptional regulator [Fulvivirga sp. RKSG066]|uniref:ArsR/SmtB family transcription factor n=1 Tax=Fulvivirga aurantia TaxID=2529383 RepID=UPI0012BC2D1C|nr:metalloregulator ArsR/SmtB family transcription factor [Fulvivirga aurantia]MTI21620.1 ArsR family transcriptional regulator [Fulvivirga aurantia]
MGLTKADKFTATQNRIALMAKALGHPARIAIIEYLAISKSCVCGDIVNELPLSQSTVSQHLKELKNAGLIKGTIEGPSVCYCIDDRVWKEARESFAGLFASYIEDNNCC